MVVSVTIEHKKEVLPIYGVTPFTMLDYPGKIACIIWFAGCNMRCGYCHNPQIVKGKGRGTVEEVLNFLEKRKGLLDGVVLSGGEATSYKGLRSFIIQIRSFNYSVKLDTNGLRPNFIKKLLNEGLLDFVALDYKAPPYKFKEVTGVAKYSHFNDTLDLLCEQNNISFEVRTTVHTDLLDEEDISFIINDLNNRKFSGNYYIQNFCGDNERPTLNHLMAQKKEFNFDKLRKTNMFSVTRRNF